MELISPQSGQSLQLIVMDEIRPLRGGIFLADFAAAIMQRYRFMVAPEQLGPNQPAKFQTGVFHTDFTISITNLDIYGDGVIVTSNTTDDADVVLDDFVSWTAEQFKLRQPTTLLPRTYQSTVVVSLARSLDRFISNFQKVNDLITKAFAAQSRLSVTRLTIGPYPAGQYPFQTTWNIEPRLGQPFVPNRYLSTAPLTTTAHVELLTELEAAMR